jgi:plastocyanin
VGGESIGPGVVITAQNIQFEPTAVTVAADEPFAIVFDNRDEGIPHDLEVSDANGNVIVKSEIVNGPTRLVVQVPALGAGTYPFVCVVHPNMTGTITAE